MSQNNGKNVRNASKARKSILRGTKDYVAQTVPLTVGDDVYRFDIRELSPEATAALEAWAPDLAMELGCPSEIAADKDQMAEWIDEHRTDILENGKSLGENITDRLEDLWNITLRDAVGSWDLDEEFSSKNLDLLPRVIKSKLHSAICAGSTLGEGAEDFFRRRAAAAP